MTTTNIQYIHPARSIHHEAGSIVSILQMVELRLSKEEGLAQGHTAGVLALVWSPELCLLSQALPRCALLASYVLPTPPT